MNHQSISIYCPNPVWLHWQQKESNLVLPFFLYSVLLMVAKEGGLKPISAESKCI